MTSYKALSSEFRQLFRQFRLSAFRLETLQKYAVWYEDEPFRDFLAGRPRYSHPSHAQWVELIRDNIRQGKTMSRVHIVTEPPSDYVRFELLWPYTDNVAAGEEVRILSVPDGNWPSSLPRQDFWVFDSQTAAVMHYDADGRFLEAELTDDPERVRQFLEWRDTALASSVDYEAYVSEMNIKAN